jgi:pyridoxamine 5'-phosphate oxidase
MICPGVDNRRAIVLDDEMDRIEKRSDVTRIDRADAELIVDRMRHRQRIPALPQGTNPGSAAATIAHVNISDRRKEYAGAKLDEGDVARDPLDQFAKWFGEALASELPEPTAMALATVGPGAQPSARMVLMKGYDARGFVFFTNYESRKGRELTANPRAALLFFWPELERQIRIEGALEKVSAAESDEYFKTRPVPSRIGAWASPQSEVISKAALIVRVAEMGLRHGLAPSRPPHWGGYRLAAEAFEFWQGRPNRLHDRIRYRRDRGGAWTIERLAP